MKEKDFHFTGYNYRFLEQVRELRKGMTPHEKHLWHDYLKDYPIRFYRQRSVDRFILDFYCSAAKLVVELDGGQHETEDGKKYDAARTEILKQYGLEVIRFSNREIEERFSDVCIRIDSAVQSRLKEIGLTL